MDETYQLVADKLYAIGWRSPCDAQWTNLRDALPELRQMLTPPDGELRDRFAAQAMQGFCSRTDEPFDVAVSLNRHETFVVASFADFAYRVADAMLKARG